LLKLVPRRIYWLLQFVQHGLLPTAMLLRLLQAERLPTGWLLRFVLP
jgi:hypothetical protein